MNEQVRVRFAPSPTGYLHVGGARTALFNWLFARRHGGTFIVRIEDTDFARSSEEMAAGILDGMRWLGLDWDEGPYYQSRRLERHGSFAELLLESRSAYRCFCRDGSGRGKGIGEENQAFCHQYSCPDLTAEEADRRKAAGESYAVRFRVPAGATSFHDLVFGNIDVDNSTLDDFVLLRSDGVPTYHLSVVADDLDMGITHVIRGADHISNTPKQILLYQAVNRRPPEFAHLPLILGPDKQRLSKRHGATSVMAYAESGYLPEAFFNFLSLLGWSPGDDRDILSRDELIRLFSLEGVGRSNAVFGIDKLDWFNSRYIREASPEHLREAVIAELKTSRIWDAAAVHAQSLDATVELIKGRARKMSDFSATFKAFFTDDFDYDPAAAQKFLADPKLGELLPSLLRLYREDGLFTPDSTESALRSLAGREGVKAGLLINALRVGLTGQGVAPGLFDIMAVLGKEKTLARMQRLCVHLQSGTARIEDQ
ncbi:MAG TPA: glutamate--tRNA ligase [Acidobacteriota bacterium]|nr:glutamate--tRNA ligase [Acidobacteriota bacterium]